MFVILEYTDEAFKRLEERAFINSRTIGEYIRRVTDYPANDFKSWRVEGITNPEPPEPILDDLVASEGEPELYVGDKPTKRKYHRIKHRKKIKV